MGIFSSTILKYSKKTIYSCANQHLNKKAIFLCFNANNKNMKNILLYFSAFVPLYFLILIKFVVGVLVGTIYFTALTVATMVLYFLLSVLGIYGLILNMKHNKGVTTNIKVEKVKNITDQHFLSYFSLFVLFALGFQLTKPSMLAVSIIIIIFIGIVYINNDMYYINPLLNILGFNFYEITFTLNNKQIVKKVYFRGKLEEKSYLAHFKNQNFSFLEVKGRKNIKH